MPRKPAAPSPEPGSDSAARSPGPAPADLPETYEAAREELVDTVRRLEAGGTTLEDSITLWERGEALADACARMLDGARARLEAGTNTDDGPADDGSVDDE